MARYLCMFVDHADEVFGSEFVDAEGDDEAIGQALSIYSNGIGKGYEIWRGDQLVHTHTHGRTI
jgi:hypothetical protein